MNTKTATASPRDPGAATNIAGRLNTVLAVVLSLGVGFQHGVFTGLAACFGLAIVSDVWLRGARSRTSSGLSSTTRKLLPSRSTPIDRKAHARHQGLKLRFFAAFVPIPWALVLCANIGARLAAAIVVEVAPPWRFPSWIWLATVSWAGLLVLACVSGNLYRWLLAHVGPCNMAGEH